MGLAPLPREFFDRPADVLAPRLLGCRLVVGDVVLRITEVEAYLGPDDPGSHAYRGRTARNATMFGEAGHLYVYRHMGLHSCANIVADSSRPNGCLLRAGEVVEGLDMARARRSAAGVTRTDTDLAQGPGRLTVAMGLTWHDDGLDLCSSDPKGYLADRIDAPAAIIAGPRIGLRPEATDPPNLQLRFSIADNPTVSKPRPKAS